MKLKRVALSIALLCLSFAAVANAHPGRLDERGGHTCHTNCAKWGLDDGEYHYHRSQAKFLPPSENSGDTDAGLDLEEDYISTDPSPQEAAAIGSIRVNLPLFDVIVNDHPINNYVTPYPIIEYKGITYFPMTFHYAQALGLTTSWDQSTGFSVRRTDDKGAKPYVEVGTPPSKFSANLPQFNVFVNDSWIDNSKEEYPFLVLNDVTYFPMTWKFAVEQLGLTTKFENNTFYLSK